MTFTKDVTPILCNKTARSWIAAIDLVDHLYGIWPVKYQWVNELTGKSNLSMVKLSCVSIKPDLYAKNSFWQRAQLSTFSLLEPDSLRSW